MWVRKQQLEPDMEPGTGSNLGKKYIKAVYCHHVYLTYMQSVSCEMLGWMNHKLESRLLGDSMGREEGGGFRMGNTCIPVADSF